MGEGIIHGLLDRPVNWSRLQWLRCRLQGRVERNYDSEKKTGCYHYKCRECERAFWFERDAPKPRKPACGAIHDR